MHTETELESLKRAVPLWRIASERVPSLKRNGKEFLGLCPFHSEKSPSFTVYQDGEVWLFKCHGCQESGNIFQLISKLDYVSFDEAVEKVKSYGDLGNAKVKIEQAFSKLGKEQSGKVLTYPLSCLQVPERDLQTNTNALAWLESRGISVETVRRFHLGYVQSLPPEIISPTHEFKDKGWILFPYLSGDTIILLKYRSVQGKKTPSGESGIIRKSGMATGLFNIDAVSPFEDLFVVEGEPDCLIMAQAGFSCVALPSAGFRLTPEMWDCLRAANTVYLAGDSDQPGQESMYKIWNDLRDRTFLLKWPEGIKDANECFLKTCGGSVEKFKTLIEEMKAKSQESPMPHIHMLTETIRNADYTKPLDNPARLHFEWPDVDSWCAIVPGDLMFLSATDTGTGKTAWLMGVLLHNALKYSKTIVSYSAELTPDQYARRAVAYLASKDEKTKADRNDLTPEHYKLALKKMQDADARFYTGYKAKANYKEVIELVTWAKRRLGADIIAIDHIHFLTRSEKDEIKAQSEAMRMLKDLAWEYNCIVIVVGQPRKPKADHRGREAVTQDLKGSEALGSDASAVFLLHRDRVSNTQDGEPIFSDWTKVKLDKSRESQSKATTLLFLGNECRFVERNYRPEGS